MMIRVRRIKLRVRVNETGQCTLSTVSGETSGLNWNRTIWIISDIFVEVSVIGFVKLCPVFVMAIAEASGARMMRVLDNVVRVRLPKPTRRWGLRNIIYGNCQQHGDLAGKLGLAVCKDQSHLFAAIRE